jgi:hypothetical protein
VIFLDGGNAVKLAPLVVSMLAPAGILVKTADCWPRDGGDPTREASFNDTRIVAVEIQTTPDTAAVTAGRRGG